MTSRERARDAFDVTNAGTATSETTPWTTDGLGCTREGCGRKGGWCRKRGHSPDLQPNPPQPRLALRTSRWTRGGNNGAGWKAQARPLPWGCERIGLPWADRTHKRPAFPRAGRRGARAERAERKRRAERAAPLRLVTLKRSAPPSARWQPPARARPTPPRARSGSSRSRAEIWPRGRVRRSRPYPPHRVGTTQIGSATKAGAGTKEILSFRLRLWPRSRLSRTLRDAPDRDLEDWPRGQSLRRGNGRSSEYEPRAASFSGRNPADRTSVRPCTTPRDRDTLSTRPPEPTSTPRCSGPSWRRPSCRPSRPQPLRRGAKRGREPLEPRGIAQKGRVRGRSGAMHWPANFGPDANCTERGPTSAKLGRCSMEKLLGFESSAKVEAESFTSFGRNRAKACEARLKFDSWESVAEIRPRCACFESRLWPKSFPHSVNFAPTWAECDQSWPKSFHTLESPTEVGQKPSQSGCDSPQRWSRLRVKVGRPTHGHDTTLGRSLGARPAHDRIWHHPTSGANDSSAPGCASQEPPCRRSISGGRDRRPRAPVHRTETPPCTTPSRDALGAPKG